MRTLPLLLLLCFLASCKKEKIEMLQTTPEEMAIPYSEVSYSMIVSMNWKEPAFTVPAGVHVTALIGIVHSGDTSLWSPGRLASKGLEDVAEVGNVVNMNLELDAILAANKALAKFSLAAPAVTGTLTADFNFNTNFTNISFASMIAPSPDWFMGLHDVNLFKNNHWVSDTTINLLVYDAGTEEGDVFGYNNPDTSPQEPVALLTATNASVLANSNPFIGAIGTVRFVRK